MQRELREGPLDFPIRSMVTVDQIQVPKPLVAIVKYPNQLRAKLIRQSMTLGKFLKQYAFYGKDRDLITHTSFGSFPRPGKFHIPLAKKEVLDAFLVLSEMEHTRVTQATQKASAWGMKQRNQKLGVNLLSERGTPVKSLLFDIDYDSPHGFIDIGKVWPNGKSILEVIHEGVRSCFDHQAEKAVNLWGPNWCRCYVASASAVLRNDPKNKEAEPTYKTSYTLCFKYILLPMRCHPRVYKQVVHTLTKYFGQDLDPSNITQWSPRVLDEALMRTRQSNRNLYHDKVKLVHNPDCHRCKFEMIRVQRGFGDQAGSRNLKCTCKKVMAGRALLPFACMNHEGKLRPECSFMEFAHGNISITNSKERELASEAVIRSEIMCANLGISDHERASELHRLEFKDKMREWSPQLLAKLVPVETIEPRVDPGHLFGSFLKTAFEFDEQKMNSKAFGLLLGLEQSDFPRESWGTFDEYGSSNNNNNNNNNNNEQFESDQPGDPRDNAKTRMAKRHLKLIQRKLRTGKITNKEAQHQTNQVFKMMEDSKRASNKQFNALPTTPVSRKSILWQEVLRVLFPCLAAEKHGFRYPFKLNSLTVVDQTWIKGNFVSRSCICLVNKNRYARNHVHRSNETSFMIRLTRQGQLSASVFDFRCSRDLGTDRFGNSRAKEIVLLSNNDSASLRKIARGFVNAKFPYKKRGRLQV